MRPFVLLAACGQPATSAVEIEEPVLTEPVAKSKAPVPAPEPAPYMRRPLHCCGDPLLEPLVQAYLAVGEAMAAEGDLSAPVAALVAESAGVIEVTSTADLLAIDAAVGALAGCADDACFEPYGALSGLLASYLEGSHSGDLDLAVAYSRRHDAEWIQDGVQIRSPYGDDVVSFAWGSRASVIAADQGSASGTKQVDEEPGPAPLDSATGAEGSRDQVAASQPPE